MVHEWSWPYLWSGHHHKGTCVRRPVLPLPAPGGTCPHSHLLDVKRQGSSSKAGHLQPDAEPTCPRDTQVSGNSRGPGAGPGFPLQVLFGTTTSWVDSWLPDMVMTCGPSGLAVPQPLDLEHTDSVPRRAEPRKTASQAPEGAANAGGLARTGGGTEGGTEQLRELRGPAWLGRGAGQDSAPALLERAKFSFEKIHLFKSYLTDFCKCLLYWKFGLDVLSSKPPWTRDYLILCLSSCV